MMATMKRFFGAVIVLNRSLLTWADAANEQYYENLLIGAGDHHPHRRSGTVDLANIDNGNGGKEVAICHILGLLAASHPDDDDDDLLRCDPSHLETKYSEMVGALLAIQHFNARNGSVVPDLGQPQYQNCPIKLTSEWHDDHHNPSHAVQVLTRIFAERFNSRGQQNDNATTIPTTTPPLLPMPCAVHGAGWSSVSKPTAVVTGSYGLPQMSYLSTSPELSQRWNYPTFSRAVPTDAAAASAAARFFDYCDARHVAVLFLNDSYGNEFHRAFREVGMQNYDMNVLSVPLPIEPTQQDIDDATKTIAKSGYHYMFAIIFEQHFESVMSSAVQQGIAGTGDHFWLLGNNGIKEMLQKKEASYEPGSELAIATKGIGILPEFGGQPISSGFQRFLNAWKK